MGQLVEEGSFAGLAWGVEEEILLYLNESGNLIVNPPEGIYHVMILRIAQSCGIKKSFHGVKIKGYKDLKMS